MGQIAKRIADRQLRKLIRAFLNAGVMENGLVSTSVEGNPQGESSLNTCEPAPNLKESKTGSKYRFTRSDKISIQLGQNWHPSASQYMAFALILS